MEKVQKENSSPIRLNKSSVFMMGRAKKKYYCKMKWKPTNFCGDIMWNEASWEVRIN